MNKTNNKLKIKMVLLVVIVLSFSIGAFCLIKSYLPHEYGTTTGNYMNRQWIVELDGELYFFAGPNEGNGLYRMDKEENISKIADEIELCLNGVDEYIYFQKRNVIENKDQIVKMRKDGSERQVLFEGNIGSDLIVVDDKMYFSYTPENSESENIYSLTTNGEYLKKTTLSRYALLQLLLNPQMNKKDVDFTGTDYNSSVMQIRGEHIYLYQIPKESSLEYDTLYRVKKNGKEAEFLADRVTAFNVAEDNYLYYAQLNEEAGSITISKMSVETLKSEQLLEMETDGEKVLWLDVAADKIYIAVENTGGYFLDTDGTNLIEVSDLVKQIGN